jgi:hypothetical protein
MRSVLAEGGPPSTSVPAICAVCYMSGVSSEERERLEENLADVEEATEQRMHSVTDLILELLASPALTSAS